MWKAIETKARKIGVVKTKGGGKKRRGWKEVKRERRKKERKKERKENTQERIEDKD